jgi:hypothetical protein
VVFVTSLALLATPLWQGQVADSSPKLSKGFMDAATRALVSIHSVKQSVLNIVENNLPTGSGYFDPKLGTTAYEQLRQAQIAATTSGDQQASTLLGNYFQQVKAWADKYKEARQSMDATNTMNRSDITEDPQLQGLDACEKGLNSMLISGVYSDVDSCQQ